MVLLWLIAESRKEEERMYGYLRAGIMVTTLMEIDTWNGFLLTHGPWPL